MTTLKIGEKEYNVQYGYKVTWKSGIIKKLASLSNEEEGEEVLDRIEKVMGILPELLLIGLQKYHADKFGYNYENNDGKEDAIDNTCDLLDEYFGEDESGFEELLEILEKELLENGFLAKMFQQEKAKKK